VKEIPNSLELRLELPGSIAARVWVCVCVCVGGGEANR